MGSNGYLLLQLVLIAVLILINAYFSASEIAIISSNDSKFKYMADEGDANAQFLVKLLSRPSRFLAAIQVGVTLSGLFASAVASESFADRITGYFSGLPMPQSLIKVLTVAVLTLVLSYFTLVFGELVPKRVAMHYSESLALRVARPLNLISVILRPFVSFLAFSTNLIAKLFGVKPGAEDNNVTEEEIRMMVDVGEENGTIEESEKEMINNVFEFNDRIAGEIMTHRTEISAVELTASLDEIIQIGLTEGFSRIPVFKDDLDDIVGIIYAKDLLKFVGSGSCDNFDPKDIMRPPLFVPETKKCRELFKVLKTQKQHLAVVIDEYGGTAGIITMEDLLESIVGDIQDEYDHEEEEYSMIDDSTYTIEGTTDLADASNLLDVDLPTGEYDTLGGMIIDMLGRIPDENEHPSVEAEGISFTVEKVGDRRIEKIRAVKLKPQP
jgi:putative hemolysin